MARTDPPPDAAPGPRAPRRRRLRQALGAFALAGALLAAGLAWLLASQRGNTWLLVRVSGVTFTEATGQLGGGPFSAKRVDMRIGERTLAVHGLAWQDARWQWRPHDGAWVGLELVGARAERIEIGGAASSRALTPPATLRLPMALTLKGARVGSLQVDTQPALTDLVASAEFGARGGAEHRIGALAFTWDRARVQAHGTLASDAPFALAAQAELRSHDAAATPWQAQLAARGPLANVAVQAQLGSAQAPGATLRAQASVQPFAAWPLAALAATTQDLDLAALGSGLPSTKLSGRADIDTKGVDAPMIARVSLTNALPGRWDQQRLPITALELELGGNASQRSRLVVQKLALELANGGGRIEGSGEWHAADANLALRLHGVRPAALDARAAAMTLGGTLLLQLAGLPSPDGALAMAATQTAQVRLALDGRLDARSALPVQISAQASTERSGAAWRIDLRELLARSGSARAQGTLQASRAADGAWQLRSGGELTDFDPAPWFPGAESSAWRQGPHRLGGRWHADLQAGSGLAAQPTALARLLALRGQAGLDLRDSLVAGVPLQARIALSGRTPGWSVDAELRSGDNHAKFQGRLAPRAEDDRWRADLEAPTLATLQPLARLHPALAAALQGAPLAGNAAGQLQWQGRWPALASSGSLRASGLQAGRVQAKRLAAQWQAGPDAQAPLALQFDAEQVAFDGQRADTLRARIEGSLATHRVVLDASSPLRPPAWTDALIRGGAGGSRVQLGAQGQWLPTRPGTGLLPGRWRGSAIELEARGNSGSGVSSGNIASQGGKGSGTPSAPGNAWLQARGVAAQATLDADGRVLQASLEPGRLEALGSAWRWTEASWRAAAQGKPAQAVLDAELEPLAVAPWLTRLRTGVAWGGDLALAGRAQLRWGERFAADVVLERSRGDLNLTDDAGTQAFGLSDLRFALAAQDGTWHFTQAVAGSNLGVLAGAQSLRVAPAATWPRPDTPLQGVIEWRIADLGAWTPFTPPGWRLGGTLRTSAAFGGRFGAPEIEGEISGSRLALRNLLQGVDVRDGELALTLRGNRATVERFVFKGGAGELRLAGGATLGAEPSAKLQLSAERFQLLGRFDRRVVASGNAELALTAQSLQLDGKLRIDEGLVDFSRTDAPSLDSDVQVSGGRAASAASAAAGADDGTAPARNGRAARSVRVALQVDLGEDLKVRGHGLDTRLRGNLAITAPGGRVALNGSVRTEAGSYAAYGQKLAIERGVLTFTGTADNPRLDILAVRPNLDLRVGVLISGRAQNPHVRLFSEPELSDTDKLSWLVLGRAPDGLARNDTALLQRAALALLAGQGQGLDRTLLANLGLDELSVRQIENGEVRDTVVTLGKQLSRRWYVGYERGLNSTTGTWQLIYRVAQRFTVRAQAGEDNALDAIWTWRWN